MTGLVDAARDATARVLPCVCIMGVWAAPAQGDGVPPTASAPVFHPGDCWVFDLVDPLDRSSSPRRRHEWVYRVPPQGGAEITSGPHDELVRILLDPAGNYVQRYGIRWEPNEGYLRFPLAVGSTWHSSMVTHSPRVTRAVHKESDFRVKSFGKVHVEAGDFEAFEVREIGTGQTEGSPFHFSIHGTFWYAPSIGRMVLVDSESHDLRDFRRFHQELVRYVPFEGSAGRTSEASAPSQPASGGETSSLGHC